MDGSFAFIYMYLAGFIIIIKKYKQGIGVKLVQKRWLISTGEAIVFELTAFRILETGSANHQKSISYHDDTSTIPR